MKVIIHWIILSIAVWATTMLISGVTVSPVWVCLIVGACLTLFNMFLQPIITILTIPINFLTLGIFSLLVNGALFWYLGKIIKGFSVTTFTAAVIGAILVSVINWVLVRVFRFSF